MKRSLLLPGLVAVLIGCSMSDTSMHSSAYAPPLQLLKGTQRAVIQTDYGVIELELYADKAPKAVTNFVELAKNNFYDGLTFHRTIPDFVIQGGDPRGDGTGGASIYGQPFEDEFSDLSMERGVLAMANKGTNSNLSQFFIIQRKGGAPWLQGKHTIFGRVTEGMDIVDKIVNVPSDAMNQPLNPVRFTVSL